MSYRPWDRFIVKHYISDQTITNNFAELSMADEFIGVLRSLQGIDKIELIGVREETHEISTWERDLVEVVHGEWRTDGIAAVCNQCGTKIVIEQYDGKMNFCMNCGAKMECDT